MENKRIKRAWCEDVYIRCYEASDGKLSFMAVVTAGPNQGRATTPPPSYAECEKILPEGWTLFEEGGSIRAKQT